MKKNFILLLCIISLVAVALASCQEPHEHTFSDKWYNDADNHWHPATCEHAETERSKFGAHADADEDGICDVCEYEVGHTHTNEAAWSNDDTHHWKSPTCSHDEKGEYSTHSDEDVNGSCDVCSGHVHNVNPAGYCTFSDCGKKVREVDETSLDELVNAIFTQKHLVNGGSIDYLFEGRSNTSSDYVATNHDIINYTFGKDNYTHINVASSVVNAGVQGTGTFKSWYQLVGPESVFGVVSEDGGALSLELPEVAKLNGHLIAMSTLVSEYGVEETLYALYEVAVGDTSDELEVIPDSADNKVTFKYNYKTIFVNETEVAVGDENIPVGTKIYNVNYFEVEVTFKYTDDYALTDLMILVDCYTNDPGTSQTDGFLYKDVDIQYDPETDSFIFIEYEYVKDENDETGESYIWVANPTDKRTPDTYVINVSQTVGDRIEENPHPKSEFVPDSFDLFATKEYIFDEKGNDVGYNLKDKIVGIISANVGNTVYIYIDNYTPDNTSLHFIANQVTFKLYRNGVLVENAQNYTNEIAVAEFTFSGELRSFFVIPKVDGAYTLEIYVAGEKKSEVKIHAGVVDEEFIELKDNEFAVKVTETYTWSNEVTFTAPESGTYYFNIPGGIGFMDADGYDEAEKTEATDDTPIPYFDYNTDEGGSFRLVLEEGQTIRFYVNATKKGTFIISYSII